MGCRLVHGGHADNRVGSRAIVAAWNWERDVPPGDGSMSGVNGQPAVGPGHLDHDAWPSKSVGIPLPRTKNTAGSDPNFIFNCLSVATLPLLRARTRPVAACAK